MALPIITVRGQVLDASGAPSVGSVRFTLTNQLNDTETGVVYMPRVIEAVLDETGSFEQALVATEGVDANPHGVGYKVQLVLANGTDPDRYTVVLDESLAPSVDIAHLPPSQPVVEWAYSGGIPGPQGDVGPAGPAGPPGPVGAMGPQGNVGPAGAQGVVGAQGPVGPKGDAGNVGPAGPAGAVGAQGAAGAVGPQGPQGIQGIQGNKGTKGDPGVEGPVGPAGPAGVAGAVGPQGPQGNIGPAGAQGPQGPIGPASLDWRGVWVKDVNYVIDDVVSFGGASWVALTPNIGVAPVEGANWTTLATRGAQGIQGPAGAAGPQGIQGPAGADGAVGPVGPAGAAGAQGPAGAQGVKGDTGDVGPQGPAGADGAVGPQGPAGAAGAAGAQGPAGAQGTQGIQGPQGIQGVPGDTHVPDPTGRTNGEWLVVAGGALVYAPAPNELVSANTDNITLTDNGLGQTAVDTGTAPIKRTEANANDWAAVYNDPFMTGPPVVGVLRPITAYAAKGYIDLNVAMINAMAPLNAVRTVNGPNVNGNGGAFVNDDVLFVTLPANNQAGAVTRIWKFECQFAYLATTTAKLRIGVFYPAGVTVPNWTTDGLNSGVTTSAGSISRAMSQSTATPAVGAAGITAEVIARPVGTILQPAGNAGGNFGIRYAHNTPEATDAYSVAYSSLTVRRLT